MMVTGMLPQHWMDQRLQFSPVAYATDASEEGGGACSTIGLTARGRAKCHMGCCESFDYEGGQADPVVLIEAFGGIGGLRRSMELLGVMPLGTCQSGSFSARLLVFKSSAILRRSSSNREEAAAAPWRFLFKEEWFTQGQPPPSTTSAARGKSLRQSRIIFLSTFLMSSTVMTKAQCFFASFMHIGSESMVMDETDLVVQTEAIGCDPIFVEAAEVLHCRRPRLFWIKGLEVIEGKDLVLYRDQQVGTLTKKLTLTRFTVKKPPLELFLREGCSKLTQKEEPFFTFARPHPKASEPREAAGYDRCNDKTLGRWRGDAWRLAPYQYSDQNMVRSPHGVRRLLGDEQLRMLGYNSDHFQIKQKISEDQQQQLTGNTWPVLVVARLLAAMAIPHKHFAEKNITEELWEVWRSLEERVTQLRSQSWAVKFGPLAGAGAGSFHLRSRLVEGARRGHRPL